MQIDFINENINQPAILIPAIEQEQRSNYDLELYKQYNPKEHKVNSTIHRPDKRINVSPEEQRQQYDANNPTPPESVNVITKLVLVNRIILALQKLIVSRKTAFTTGGEIVLKAQTDNDLKQEFFDSINDTWKRNKLQYKNSDLFKRLISETEVAEIWYSSKTDDNRIEMKMQIYSPEMGYDLYPVFDSNRDMIAFGLGYEITNGQDKIKMFDLYADDNQYRYAMQAGGNWGLLEEYPIQLNYGKIPVVYYAQKHTAWNDVQNIIERIEYLLSNFADTNDYNGSPILLASGEIHGWSAKGETGKVIEAKDGADLKYVSWDNAPESIKLELETLFDLLFTTTQTPNISFKEMKGLGDISAVAFDRIMIDAHLSARDYHTGVYGEGIQRRLNFLKYAVSAINADRFKSILNMDITPVFSMFSIDNLADRVDLAMKANGGLPVWSQKEAIGYVGTTDDVEETLNEINNNNSNQLNT